ADPWQHPGAGVLRARIPSPKERRGPITRPAGSDRAGGPGGSGMIRRRRGALQVEPLEGKVLLSTAAARAHAVAKQVAPLPFSISGNLQMPTSSVATFQVGGQTMGTFKVRGKL